MSYSIDLRKRVVEYVHNGGQQTDAVRLFQVSRKTIYNWLKRDDLSPTVRGPRKRKMDRDDLASHVEAYPDALLRERAEHFGVCTNAVWEALQKMEIRKKNQPLC